MSATNPKVYTVNYKEMDTAPDPPPAGQVRTYFDGDGVMKILNSAGTATEVVTDPPTALDPNTFVFLSDDGTFTASDAPTDGQLLIGKTGADPQVGNIFAAEDEGIEVTYDDPDILIGTLDASASVKGSVTTGEQTFGGAKTFQDAATFSKGQQSSPVARTATADGSGTGTIAAGTRVVAPTSDDANKIIVLPAPVPGDKITLLPTATGYELRTSNPATISLNNVSGAGKELAVAAATRIEACCESLTAWTATKIDNVGAPSGAGTPD